MARRERKREENPLQTPIQLLQIDINGLSKRSVNKNPLETQREQTCRMIACVQAMKSMSEAIKISQHGLSPPFLLYSVCLVVSYLLIVPSRAAHATHNPVIAEKTGVI